MTSNAVDCDQLIKTENPTKWGLLTEKDNNNQEETP